VQEPRYSPVKALVNAVPAKGARKYDFLKQLLEGLTSNSPSAAKYDIVWDLLHAAKTRNAPGDQPPNISAGPHKLATCVLRHATCGRLCVFRGAAC
jgi:hypothetical protein